MVVICSKFITFAVTKTMFTWKRDSTECCDLLKIHYLCGDKDNRSLCNCFRAHVVICSKFITFAVTKTILTSNCFLCVSLWFAQNSLPLRWQRQYCICITRYVKCCDLLKIHYLCGDKDNAMFWRSVWLSVVICSKFITFAVTKTMLAYFGVSSLSLWFAQNSLPLRWQRQYQAKYQKF